MENTSEIGELDLSSPEKIFNAYGKLGDVETKFINEIQAVYGEFDEVQGDIQAAIEEGRMGNLIDWAVSKFKDSEAKKTANKALESIRKKYKETVDKNKKRVEELENAMKKVLAAAENINGGIDAEHKKLGDFKTETSSKRADLEQQRTQLQTARSALSGRREKLDGDFRKALEAIEQRLIEIQKRLDEIANQKVSILQKKEEAEDARGKEKDSAKKAKLSKQINIFENQLAGLNSEEESLLSEKENLARQESDINAKYNKESVELGAEEQRAESASLELDAAQNGLNQQAQDSEKRGRDIEMLRKNTTEAVLEMRKAFEAWGKNNMEIMRALEQQKDQLDKTEVKGPTIGNSLWNTPVVGKWGALGLITLPGRGVEAWWDFLDNKTGAGEWWEKNKHSLSALGGFLDGCKNLVQGVVSIVGHPTDMADGIIDLVSHPKKFADVGKAIIQYDEFKEGRIAYGIGKIIPDIALIIASSGTGAAVSAGGKAGSVGKVLIGGLRNGLADEAGRITVGSAAKGVLWKVPKTLVLGAGKFAVTSGRMLYELVKAPFVAISRASRMWTGFKMGLKGQALKDFMIGTQKAGEIVEKLPKWRIFERRRIVREAENMVKARTELKSQLADMRKKVPTAKKSLLKQLKSERKLREVKIRRQISELNAGLKQAELRFGGRPWESQAGVTASSEASRISRVRFAEMRAQYLEKAKPLKEARAAVIRSRDYAALQRADEALWRFRLQYAKEGVVKFPGVRWAADATDYLRRLTLRGLANSARQYPGKLVDLVKSIPDKLTREKILSFMKGSMSKPIEFLRIIANDFMIIPSRMRIMLMDPKLSFAEKFVGILKEYPQLMYAIKTMQTYELTPENLAKRTDQIIADDDNLKSRFEELEAIDTEMDFSGSDDLSGTPTTVGGIQAGPIRPS